MIPRHSALVVLVAWSATAVACNNVNGQSQEQTMTNHTHPLLELQTQQCINDLYAKGGEPLSLLSPEAARDVWAGAQAAPVTKLPASSKTSLFQSVPRDR